MYLGCVTSCASLSPHAFPSGTVPPRHKALFHDQSPAAALRPSNPTRPAVSTRHTQHQPRPGTRTIPHMRIKLVSLSHGREHASRPRGRVAHPCTRDPQTLKPSRKTETIPSRYGLVRVSRAACATATGKSRSIWLRSAANIRPTACQPSRLLPAAACAHQRTAARACAHLVKKLPIVGTTVCHAGDRLSNLPCSAVDVGGGRVRLSVTRGPVCRVPNMGQGVMLHRKCVGRKCVGRKCVGRKCVGLAIV